MYNFTSILAYIQDKCANVLTDFILVLRADISDEEREDPAIREDTKRYIMQDMRSINRKEVLKFLATMAIVELICYFVFQHLGAKVHLSPYRLYF